MRTVDATVLKSPLLWFVYCKEKLPKIMEKRGYMLRQERAAIHSTVPLN